MVEVKTPENTANIDIRINLYVGVIPDIEVPELSGNKKTRFSLYFLGLVALYKLFHCAVDNAPSALYY